MMGCLIMIIIIVRYWDIPLRLASAATYPREYVKRIHCERDLHSLLQILPENFVWILRYFSNYALLPLHVLVSEVYNLEIYLYGLDPNFFGSSTLPVEKPSKIRQREFTTKKRENFKYCDCEKCAEVDRLYPKSSERIT
ncbi:uncharacterized protein LOC111698762 [Eurytemora carolleeae]|uniref:uncharacterized protein LOC111698762 n=1 Tax=Eurytemora carolleeae TaxID=1294199 RepID=UPI000C76C739|nr:uncharacterized protein LOC111698762 [Eurytemora carolleeae]|eukprot:XP_023324953.1 uncharacterized protein LOC111698762 [Eurytemora affinis]